MSTQLDIFAHRFGDEVVKKRVVTGSDDAHAGEVGLKMLAAIQTVVDVLADDINTGYTVGFADFAGASSNHRTKRIAVSGLPLLQAKPGTPYRDIAAILTGFAVHEVGHTKRVGIIEAVKAEWPNRDMPKTLGNIVEDVVLERRTIHRYAGFRNVFDAAFEWVAEATCPKWPLAWSGSTGHKVNFAGQVVRYLPWTSYAPDEQTQRQLRWWREWGEAITWDMTPAQGVEHVRKALNHIAEPEEPGDTTDGGDGEPGEGEPGEGKPPKGAKPKKADPDDASGVPDEEDEEPTEGEGEPNDDDTEGDDGEGESDPGDGTEGDDGDGSGSGESDEDGEADGEGESEDGEAGDGNDGSPTNKGDGLDADTMNRTDKGKGGTDADGTGGSGQAVAEASGDGNADPEDWRRSDLDKTFDEVAEAGRNESYRLQAEVEQERVTTRIEAGVYGKLRVVFRD